MWPNGFTSTKDPVTGEQYIALRRDFSALEIELLEHLDLWDELGEQEGLEHA